MKQIEEYTKKALIQKNIADIDFFSSIFKTYLNYFLIQKQNKMKKQNKTNKKQWIKPEIQVLVVQNAISGLSYDTYYYAS